MSGLVYRFNFLIVAALVSLLSGCASVDQMQQKLSQSTAPQASSITTMTYTPLKTGVVQTVVFGDQTPTFQFPHGKGYYAAFELAETGKPRLVSVKADLSSMQLSSASILIPNILILDKDKQQVAKLENYRLETEPNVLTGLGYYADLPLPANAAYLIVYAAPTHAEKINLYSGDGTEYTAALAPAGKLLISVGKLLPMDTNFSKAIIKDSVKVHASDKADFFYVDSVNGKSIKNSLQKSLEVNRGKGRQLFPYLIDRQVPANEPVKLILAAKTQYATPIQELFKKGYQVNGEITFTPGKDKKYVVKGELKEGSASLWLEDAETHQIVDKKIQGNGK